MLYAVTGSTGAFGTLAVHHLLKLKVPAASIVALARDEAKAAGLKALGVQVRVADYGDKASLEKALKGVERLLLVSGNDFSQRAAHHKNVIDAAKADGVKLIAYTSVSKATTSTNVVAADHKATEEHLKKAGIPFVLLRNNWYTENYADDVKHAKDSGVIALATANAKVASASRTDYAEAAAKVLTGEGHSGKVYELTGAAWDFNELAKVASEVVGRPVTYQALTADARHKALVSFGLPEAVAGFVTALDTSVAAGTLADATGDLEKLLGRKPATLKEGLKAVLGA
jgi:NAD(P)H dehydrogenase (quinone)